LFALYCGIAAIFGYSKVSINGQYCYGFKGFVASLAIGIIFPVIFSAFLWCLMTFGLWLSGFVRKITITIKE